MSRKLLLFPFGGNAREALLSVFALNSERAEWDIIGFIDDNEATWTKDCCGIKVLGGREVITRFPDAHVLAVNGNSYNHLKRRDVISSLKVEASRFATIIHPSVVVSPDARIGYNTLIMSNVVVSCGTSVGNHCVILPNTVISHDSIIGDYCCIGSNVSVSGSVVIGSSCYIGSGTRIRNNITIGQESLIGLGSNVVSDIQEGVIAAGNPAKVMRKVVR